MLRRVLLLMLFGFSVFATHAQLRVVPASNQSSESIKPGFYYALPMSGLKFDITVKKTKVIPGPYHAYAEKYLGLQNVPYTNNTSYEIVDVKLSRFTLPDPDQFYFVEYAEQDYKDERAMELTLSEAGIITGFNNPYVASESSDIIIEQDGRSKQNRDIFHYHAENNLYEEIDTVIRKITIDTLTIEKEFYRSSWQQKSSEQKASEAANFIRRIRENRFLLISGYQEVDYGESIKYMDAKLQELEKEYLSLFTGVTISSSINYSYLIIPDKEDAGRSISLCKFSPARGIVSAGQQGNDVRIEIQPLGVEESLKDFNKMKGSDGRIGVYYRVPEHIDLKLTMAGETLLVANLLLSQFGTVSYGPVYNPQVQFYPSTGSVKQARIEITE